MERNIYLQIERELTIKKLEKEYTERQKGLAYTMKKLKEFRTEGNNSMDSIKRLDQAIQATIHK